MRRPNPADLGLLILSGAVVAGAVLVVTRDPAPPATVAAVVAATPTATSTPAGTAEAPALGRLLVVGLELAALAEPLQDTGWTVEVAPAGTESILEEGALAAVTEPPDLVALEVAPGTRTAERVAEAVTQVRGAFPDAMVVLVGPFDPEAERTTAAVEGAATEQDVVFLDPVAQGWTDGLTPEQLGSDLSASLVGALPQG